MRTRFHALYSAGVAATIALAPLALPPPARGAGPGARAVEPNVISRLSARAVGSKTEILVQGTATPSFTAYRLDQPPRLVVDVAGGRLALPPGEERQLLADTWAVGQISIDERTGDATQVSRIVVALKRPGSYTVRPQGTDLLITVIPDEAAPPVDPRAAQELSRIEKARAQMETAAQALRQQQQAGEARLREQQQAGEARLREQQQANEARLREQQQQAAQALEGARGERERIAKDLARLEQLRAELAQQEKDAAARLQEKQQGDNAQRAAQIEAARRQAERAQRDLTAAQAALAKAEQARQAAEGAQRTEEGRRKDLSAQQQEAQRRLGEQQALLKAQQAEIARLQQQRSQREAEGERRQRLADEEALKRLLAERQRTMAEVARMEQARAELAQREQALAQRLAEAQREAERAAAAQRELQLAQKEAQRTQQELQAAQAALRQTARSREEIERARQAEEARLRELLQARKEAERQVGEQQTLLKAQQAEIARQEQAQRARRSEQEAEQKALQQRLAAEQAAQQAQEQRRGLEQELGRLEQARQKREEEERALAARLQQAQREGGTRLRALQRELAESHDQAGRLQEQVAAAQKALQQAEAERQHAAERQRAEEGRLQTLVRAREQAEAERQAVEQARRAELQKLAELRQRNEAERQALERTAAAQREQVQQLAALRQKNDEELKAEGARLQSLQRARQQAEQDLRRMEQEQKDQAARLAALRQQQTEAEQKAQTARLSAQRQQEEAARLAAQRQDEATRLAAAQRQQEEAARAAAQKQQEVARLTEQARARKASEGRSLAETAQQREARQREEAQLQALQRARQQAEQDLRRMEQEQRDQAARLAALRQQQLDAEKQAQAARLAAQKQQEEAARLAALRQEEAARLARQKQQEVARLAEQARARKASEGRSLAETAQQREARQREEAQLQALQRARQQAEQDLRRMEQEQKDQAARLAALRQQQLDAEKQAQAARLAAQKQQEEAARLAALRQEEAARLAQQKQQQESARLAALRQEEAARLAQQRRQEALARAPLAQPAPRPAATPPRPADDGAPVSAWDDIDVFNAQPRTFRQAVTLRPYAPQPQPAAQVVEAEAAPAAPAVTLSPRRLAARAPEPGDGAEASLALPGGALVPVRDVRFEDDGRVTRIVVLLGAANIETTVYSDSRTAVLRLHGVSLPRELARTLDATAFHGPVQSVSSFPDPRTSRTVRLVVSLSRAVTPTLRRQGARLTWEFPRPVSAIVSLPAQRVAGFGHPSIPMQVGAATPQRAPVTAGRRFRRYEGRRIDLDFKDADIHNILRLLSDVGQVNIITTDDVKGTVTIRMRDVPWDQALDVVLKAKGLGSVREGNLIRVAPQEKLDKEAEAEAARLRNKVDLQPIETRLVPLSYADAGKMEKKVLDVLSPRGKVTVDERTNVLIISDMAANIALAEDLLRNLDTQVPQVLIEARIVEARANFTRTLGMQWGGNFIASTQTGNPTGLAFPSTVGLGGGATDQQTDQTIRNGLGPNAANPQYVVNLPAPVGLGSGGALGITLGSIASNVNVNLRLSALENTGNIRVISAPKITTTDNHEASIEQGTSIPISVVSAAGTNTQFFDAKLNLTVRPRVTNDGFIGMDLKVTRNEPDFANVGARGDPTILKREARTNMLVRDGDTAVIGGIYTRNTGQSYQKVPFLSEIPILGWLFKNRRDNDDRNELLIFITPRIMNRPGQSLPAGVAR